MNLNNYLQRIGLADATLSADASSLLQVHRAQAYHIPFENFDLQLGRSVSLAPAAIEAKLVGQRRGGYCFELNGILLQALQALGFDARALLARVHFRGDHMGRTHQLNLVQLAGQPWVADVGFGGGCGILDAAPLVYNEPFEQDGQRYRFVSHERYHTLFQVWWDNSFWKDVYSFDMAWVDDADIAMSNYFVATSPTAIFTQARMATMPLPNGRVSLSNFDLKVVRDGVEQRCQLPDGQAYLDGLREYLGIELDCDYSALRPVEAP